MILGPIPEFSVQLHHRHLQHHFPFAPKMEIEIRYLCKPWRSKLFAIFLSKKMVSDHEQFFSKKTPAIHEMFQEVELFVNAT